MAIPSRQIGWSTTDNLLWQISKQVESLGCVVACGTSGGGSGTSGSSGTSGVSGTSGSAGTAGLSGSSGSSGLTGTSGLSGDRYRTESVTEFTLGVSTVLTIGTGLSYTVAQDIIIAYDSANHQIATVVSYDSGTGILVIGPPVTVIGSGTYSDWTVNLNGAAGGDGSSGTSGSSGVSGTAGTSGIAGTSGSAGTSGANGTNGSSGTSGVNGTAGTAGITGTSGTSGSTPTTYYGAFIFNSDTTITAEIPNPSSTATIQVVSTTGFNTPGYMKIADEIIGYTGKTATTFTGITRGVASSVASSHPIGTAVAQAQATVANTPTQVKLDQTDLSVGVTLSGLGDIIIANAGVYNMQFSIQLQNFGNDYDDVAVWFKLNGNDIPKSTSYTTIVLAHAGTPGAVVMTVNIFYTIAANDVISLGWLSKSGDTTITSIVAEGATLPTSPGVIFTVNKIA